MWGGSFPHRDVLVVAHGEAKFTIGLRRRNPLLEKGPAYKVRSPKEGAAKGVISRNGGPVSPMAEKKLEPKGDLSQKLNVPKPRKV